MGSELVVSLPELEVRMLGGVLLSAEGETGVVASPAFENGEVDAACAAGSRFDRKRSRDRRKKYVRKL